MPGHIKIVAPLMADHKRVVSLTHLETNLTLLSIARDEDKNAYISSDQHIEFASYYPTDVDFDLIDIDGLRILGSTV